MALLRQHMSQFFLIGLLFFVPLTGLSAFNCTVNIVNETTTPFFVTAISSNAVFSPPIDTMSVNIPTSSSYLIEVNSKNDWSTNPMVTIRLINHRQERIWMTLPLYGETEFRFNGCNRWYSPYTCVASPDPNNAQTYTITIAEKAP